MTNPVENKINYAADSVEPSAEFSQKLWNQMRMTPLREKAPKKLSRFVWVPVLTVLGILVVMILVAPQTVLAAVKGLLAYIPGIGFIEKSDTTLYLAKPVIIEKEGYTFSLDRVVADTNKTAIAYHMVSPTNNFNHCAYNENFLLWPDGKSNNPIGGGVTSETDGTIQAQIDYFPLPEGVQQASLKVTLDQNEPGCVAPVEWTIPFTLGTAIPEIEILPVVEYSTAQVTPSDTEPSSTASVNFKIDQYVELNDGYLLTGHIENNKESWKSVSLDMTTLSAQDAKGNNVTLEQSSENLNDNEFAIKVVGKDFTSPITIEIKKLMVMASEQEPPTFTLDVGDEPQIDQQWTINQEIVFAGKAITIKDVKVIEDATKMNYPTSVLGFEINASSGTEMSVSFDCSGKEKSKTSWNQSMPGNGSDFSVQNFYPEGLPNGVVTCTIWNAFIQEAGDWKFEWQPSPSAK